MNALRPAARHLVMTVLLELARACSVQPPRRLTKIEGQRRKLLEAYYAGAVDVPTLREEQERLRRDAADVEERLRDVDATLAQWQDILGMAFRFSTVCANA